MSTSNRVGVNLTYSLVASDPAGASISRAGVEPPTDLVERFRREEKRKGKVMRLRILAVVVVSLVAGCLMSAPASPTGNAQHPTLAHMSGIQKRILSGFLSYELDLATQFSAGTLGNYQPRGNAECPLHRGSNIKVNQNCLNVSDPDLQGRGQAQNEPAIAADPNQPDHLVASANDYVRGDGTCGSYWSTDGGRTWNDSTLPNGFVRGTTFGAPRQYFQGC